MRILISVLALKTAAPEIGEQLAAMGLTAANPVVLTVSLGAAIAGTTVYLVMKASLDECEARAKEDLKQEIIEQLQNNYGLTPAKSVSFEINDGGHA